MFQIKTSRLLLRQWQEADCTPFAAINADPQVMQFFPNRLEKDQSDSLVATFQSEIESNGWGFWAVEISDDQTLAGFTGIRTTSDTPRGSCVEIGWRLARDCWGSGYATEAAEASLRFAFEFLNLSEIISFTTVDNKRSEAVMVRLGMTQRDPNFMHPKVPTDSPLCEHILYSIKASEFESTLPMEVDRI